MREDAELIRAGCFAAGGTPKHELFYWCDMFVGGDSILLEALPKKAMDCVRNALFEGARR